MQTNFFGLLSKYFDVINQLPIKYSSFVRCWVKNGSIKGKQISSRRPVFQSGERNFTISSLNLDIPMKE